MSNPTGQNKVQKQDSEKLQNKDAYRAPRLVPLGTAVGLVQCAYRGNYRDGCASLPNFYSY